MSVDVMIDSHEASTRLDAHELVRQLNAHLGPTLVATLADVRDRGLPHKWAKADGPEPRSASMTKLLAAHRAWALLSAAENDSVARAWFIGANPRLGETAPVMALREGQVKQVIAAASAFVRGADD